MTEASMAKAGEVARAAHLLESRFGVREWRIVAYVGALAFVVAWTIVQGKDLHWDAVNYHLYAGFAALHDRFALDFFAAGTPAYLNPAPLVPLYLMWRADWPAFGMAVAFASFHAILLFLVFELAVVAGLRTNKHPVPAFGILAVVLAATNPILLQGLGSTMTDPSVGVFALGGWVAVAIALRHGDWRYAILAGLLCGLAAAWKLSNAVFAIAAMPALAFMPGRAMDRIRGTGWFCIACGTSFVAGTLPWSWHLWREFGNPFFPFLNEYLHSADFVVTPIKQERFVPMTWYQFLMRPFDIVAASSAVHVESRAPDLRYIALLAAVAVLALLRGWPAGPRSKGEMAIDDGDPGAERCFHGLLIGLGVAWCLWLSISGNGRYFLPMACIAAVLLALTLQRLHAIRPSLTIGATMILLFMQGVQLALGTDLRRDGFEWEGPWLRVAIPERLRNEPYLYLAPGFQSGSIFLPYLHPQSGFINVGGFNVIGPRHPGGGRAQRLIERNADRLRLLLPLPRGAVSRATLPAPPDSLRVYFRRFGLKVDGSDCEFLRLEGNVRGERRPTDDRWKHFISCRLVAAPEERVAYEREATEYDIVFDRVEDTCPKLFFPPRPVTQEFHFWSRTYHLGSEMQLFVEDGRVKYFFYLRGGDPIDIGALEDWKRGPQPVDCSVRFKPAYANVVK